MATQACRSFTARRADVRNLHRRSSPPPPGGQREQPRPRPHDHGSMGQIPDNLRSVARRQDGLLTRSQVLAAGMSRSQMEWLVRPEGRWRRVLRGVYSVTSGPMTRRQQQRAAVLYAGTDARLYGISVVELYDLRYAPQDVRVHVLIPARRLVVEHPAVAVHRTRHLPPPAERSGLPVTPLARAVVDACRGIGDRRGVMALVAEVVQRRLCTVEALAAEVESGPTRGSARLRLALQATKAGAASAPEVDLAEIVCTSSLLSFMQVNHPVEVDGRRFVLDGCWPEARLAVEVDSVEHHGFGPDAERTSRRRNALVAAGWTVLSVSPARLRDDPKGVLAEIESAYLACLAREAG